MNSTHQRDIQNKTAIITGSDRGIGKETAIQLVDNIRNLVVCSMTQHAYALNIIQYAIRP
jgi:NAD(P)-dependent dehydrogenase (short-subunit alcohol dehydrogenase family)